MTPISPYTNDTRNYLEVKLNKDPNPKAVNKYLLEDIVRIPPETISEMCVGAFGLSTLSTMHTYRCLYLAEFI